MGWLPRIAAAVAFLDAGLVAASAIFFGPILSLAVAVIPFSAGIGILRRRAWSAYGIALYLASQLLIFLFALIRPGSIEASTSEVATSVVVIAVLCTVFVLAGRSLAIDQSRRGSPIPWIILSGVCTLPFLFVEPFAITNTAMEKTILAGDRILVQLSPRPRFVASDLVVFKFPVDTRETHVKRIIGAPGDRIRIVDKVVYRNGAALREPYVTHIDPNVDAYRDDFPNGGTLPYSPAPGIPPDRANEMLKNHVVNGEVVVPARNFFVLGDNRDNSLDSRYWGFVPFNDIIGKPLLIYESEEKRSEGRRGRIRWDRLFKML